MLVAREAEANRIHNKGAYGKPLSGGALELSLVEAAHLVETGRLAIDGLPEPTLPALVEEAVRAQPEFEIPFFVYSDLRARGYVLKHAARGANRFLVWPRGSSPSGAKPDALLVAVSEREPFVLSGLLELLADAAATRSRVTLGVVDEEGDLTHYEASLVEPEGAATAGDLPACEGTLLEDRVLLWDAGAATRLHEAEMLGKRVAGGLQLSLVEATHLVARGVLSVTEGGRGGRKPLSGRAFRRAAERVQPDLELRLAVYDDLRRRGVVAKTGFKFGAHFRCYERLPATAHAPWLVHAVPQDWQATWPEVSRAVRLAASVKKRMLFAWPGRDGVGYLRIDRMRP